MARKTDPADKMDTDIVLEMQGKKFVVSKKVLIEKSEYFKAKFGGAYRDSRETYLTYPDVPAEAFCLVHSCLLGKTISAEDIVFPIIETSLKVSEFFCIDVFKKELQQTLLKSWEKTSDPLKSLIFAEDVFVDCRPGFEKRCIEVAQGILQKVLQFQPSLEYQIVLHAIKKEDFINCGIFSNTYRFTDYCVNTIRLVFAWLVYNCFAPSKALHLVKYLKLEMFPPTFPTEVINSIKDKDWKEGKVKKQLLEIVDLNFKRIKQSIEEQLECAYILSSSYNYSKFCTADAADFNTFHPTSWTWQTDKIEIAAGSRVIHVHMINKTAYLITSESLHIIDLCTMKLTKTVKDELLTHFLNEVWEHQIQVLTCHNRDIIYIIPEEPESESYASVCPLLKFNINTESFSSLPPIPHPDTVIRAVFSLDSSVYIAGLTTSLIIFKYDALTDTYTTLSKLDLSEMLGSVNSLMVSVCFGVFGDKIYVFCFGAARSFFLTMDPNQTCEGFLEKVSLQNQHFTKGWNFTKPHLCHVKDGFLIALQINSCMPDPYTWDDILLTLFMPENGQFNLLGFLPRPNYDTGGRFGFGIQPHPF